MAKYLKLITVLIFIAIGISFCFTWVQAVEIPNPIPALAGGIKALPKYLGGVINVILSVIGAIALVIFIVGGIMWMTSGGNPEKIKKGKDTMVWGVLGLAVIFFSYAIINFVIRVITAGGS